MNHITTEYMKEKKRCHWLMEQIHERKTMPIKGELNVNPFVKMVLVVDRASLLIEKFTS